MPRTYEVHRLKVSNGFFINFTYLILDTFTRSAAVVDPSWDLARIDGLIKGLEAKLKKILITHAHFDHTNLVSPLVERYGSEVFMHRSEVAGPGFGRGMLAPFRDLDVIYLGLTPIVCIRTPGHTSGSGSFLLPNDLFTGDTLFSEGVGVCFPETGGNPSDLFRSVQRLKAVIRDNVIIHPGHSFWVEPGLSFKEIYETNVYMHFKRRADFVAFRMRQNQPPLFNWHG